MPFDVMFKHTFTDHQISGLLCSALEGGSNYWYRIVDHRLAEGVTRKDFQEGGKFTDPKNYWHPEQLIPLQPGCATIFDVPEDDDGKLYDLDRNGIEQGLKLMAEKYPQHFSDFMTENDDAITGDVFLQLCLFKDVIYG